MECSVELAGMGDGSVVRFSPKAVTASVSSSLSVGAWRGFGGGALGRWRSRPLPRPREGEEFGGSCYCVATVAVGDLQSMSRRVQEGMVRHWNDLMRRHCERVPLGLASINQALCGTPCEGEVGKGEQPPADQVGDEKTQPSGQDEKKRKTVLILMSDTGGGHRASAEAIKATFELEYGDDYKVCALFRVLVCLLLFLGQRGLFS